MKFKVIFSTVFLDMNKFISLAFFLVLMASGSRISASQADFFEIDFIVTQHKERPFNGVILIAKNEDILFEKAYGYANHEEKKPLSVFNQFLIASISKQMTAVLILQQVDAGYIKLTDSIQTYLPEVNDAWTEITIHHLLNHTSGIKEPGQPLDFKPGATFSYSNIGYDFLGDILEKVTGRPFADLSSDLFKACKMGSTFPPPTESMIALQELYKDVVVGYTRHENKLQQALVERNVKSNPSGGIISTIHDLHQWNLSLHNRKILKPETYAQMMAPTVMRENRFGEIGYGYGVHVFEKGGEISHNGIIPGYTSTLMYLKSGVHLIILENENYSTEGWGVEEQKQAFLLHDKMRKLVHLKTSQF